MARRPARLVGLAGRKGEIAPGCDADLVVLDPDATFVVDPTALHHRHRATPYEGRTLAGRVEATWLRGHVIFRAGVPSGSPLGRAILPRPDRPQGGAR
jgi:allantoinase